MVDAKSTPQSEEAIRHFLVSALSRRLEVPQKEIDITVSFFRYGLDSRDAVLLSGELEDWLGREVPASIAYEYPTAQTLAAHLAGRQKE